MKVERGKIYTCLRGNYTHDTIVKILQVGQYESKAEIISLLASTKRSNDAWPGQVWNVNNDWLVPLKNISDPNLLFSLKKREKKS